MSRLLVCIPTIEGREKFLERAMWGYRTRTPHTDMHIEVVHDYPTCGQGWQAAVERGLSRLQPPPDFIHFGNDDIMVAEGWLPPLIDAATQGFLPASRMEPAGYHLGEEPAEAIAPWWVKPNERSYFYSDLPENQPKNDWAPVDHSALPFCSVGQWLKIGRFIPIHFGTDKWFYHRARQEGITAVARMDSVIFNYATQIGRQKGAWTETDIIDFDCVFAYPAYVEGRLKPEEEDPQRLTGSGLAMVRRWRKANFDGPHHWEA
jgi:hypothetical protein